MNESSVEIFTIGHSTHAIETFIKLLKQYGVTAVVDVRSSPYSRYAPQFNKEALGLELRKHGIHYVFLGRELGAKPDDPSCFENGHVSFARLSETALFRKGLDRVLDGASKYRIALMCAEKEPLECHRTILVACALKKRGAEIVHIHADGHIESYEESISRLLTLTKVPGEDLFRTHEELVDEAFLRQGLRIAFSDDHLNPEDAGETP